MDQALTIQGVTRRYRTVTAVDDLSFSVLTILVLRRAAGKVFAMAILLRGTEPGWREIWRAARKG
jgi:hypothetical protein